MSLAQTAASLLPAVTTAKASGLADDGGERETRALGEPAPTVAPAHEATAGFGGPASAGA